MVLFLGLDQHHAVATSLLAIIPVAILGTIRQDRYGNVDRHDAVRLGALSVGGAAAGVALANALPGAVLRDLFAAFMVFVAVRLVRESAAQLDSVFRWDSTTRFTSRSWS